MGTKFESKLASRVSERRMSTRPVTGYIALGLAVFIVLTVNSSSIAASQATIHVSSQAAVAKYMDQFDGYQAIVMAAVSDSDDWVSVKLPFKGRLADLQKLTYAVSVMQAGGDVPLEPFIVLKLTEGKYLVCLPKYSYEDLTWTFPERTWAWRDVIDEGKWSIFPAQGESMIAPLADWVGVLGNRQVVSVTVFVGEWELTSQYQCYVGSISVNGKTVDLANAKRFTGGTADLPAGL